MIKHTEKYVEAHPDEFFKDRKGNFYPYLKTEIKGTINDFDRQSFLPILQDMDYAFIEERWNSYRDRNNYNINPSIIGKYIAWMNLGNLKGLRFKDSIFIEK